MEYNISDFLENVEPQILRRGREYYGSGMVENLQKSGRVFTAKVSGSEYRPYHVEITFDEDGDVGEWECDCPYDWGSVCKHIVAALLAIENGDYEEKAPSAEQPDDPADNLADLVNQADVELLKNLIIGQCRKDQRFRLEVLSTLGAAGQEELAAVKNLIETSMVNIPVLDIMTTGIMTLSVRMYRILWKKRGTVWSVRSTRWHWRCCNTF